MTKGLYTMFLGEDVVLGDFGKLPSAVVCVGDEAVRYVPERTCRNVMDGPLGSCSLCGDECFGDADAGRHCPSCGAKVTNVKEARDD